MVDEAIMAVVGGVDGNERRCVPLAVKSGRSADEHEHCLGQEVDGIDASSIDL